MRKAEWVVYSKRPFGGPEAVLAYLSRYTHRIAISNSRLVALDDASVTFHWKDYRAKGRDRAKLMTLATGEFIRRFLIHVLPDGFHRIRHYGLFANGGRADNIARARQLLNAPVRTVEPADADGTSDAEPQTLSHPCPCCGGRMIIIETFERGCSPRYRPPDLQPDRHLMITIARSLWSNAAGSGLEQCAISRRSRHRLPPLPRPPGVVSHRNLLLHPSFLRRAVHTTFPSNADLKSP